MSRRTAAFHTVVATLILATLACQAPIGEQAQATQTNNPAAFDTSVAGTVAAVATRTAAAAPRRPPPTHPNRPPRQPTPPSLR